MVENGSSSGAKDLSANLPHEYFAELCSLSTTGELEAEEWQRLEEHLRGCAECRALKRQYEEVVFEDIPVLAAELHTEKQSSESNADRRWLEEAEATLFMALEEKGNPEPLRRESPDRLPVQSQRLFWKYAVAASLLCVCGLIGYRLGLSRNNSVQPQGIQALARVLQPTGSFGGDVQASKVLPDRDSILAHFKEQLGASRRQVALLQQRQENLEAELNSKTVDLDRVARERADINQQLAQAQGKVQDLQAKLDASAGLGKMEQPGTGVFESRLQELQGQVQEKDRQLTHSETLLQHDRDIRNLIGARDLYIAEIYDVGKRGETNKPFGRVFYTKGKSLVFYAYDLDGQPGLKRAAIFQAWGRRGTDPKKDVNLGIFYQDDAANKRWILKSSDSKTLAQIDAVFVTVETKPETEKPSGKPLLFTYLRIPPNHP